MNSIETLLNTVAETGKLPTPDAVADATARSTGKGRDAARLAVAHTAREIRDAFRAHRLEHAADLAAAAGERWARNATDPGEPGDDAPEPKVDRGGRAALHAQLDAIASGEATAVDYDHLTLHDDVTDERAQAWRAALDDGVTRLRALHRSGDWRAGRDLAEDLAGRLAAPVAGPPKPRDSTAGVDDPRQLARMVVQRDGTPRPLPA